MHVIHIYPNKNNKTMKHTSLYLALTGLLAAVSGGCIRPEAPNAEADILTAQIAGFEAIRPATVTNDKVTFYANPWEDLSALAPEFTLTAGATITPESGTPQDFSHPVTYTVTSEDGLWKKAYTISVSTPSDVEVQTFPFENARLQEDKYFVFRVEGNGTSEDAVEEWASSNTGYSIGAEMGVMPNKVTDYPVYQIEEGYEGKALRLVTRSMKPLKEAFGMFMPNIPLLAAGSLYLGKLNTDFLMSDPLKATEFGTPLLRKPVMMTGYYTFTPGPEMIDAKGEPTGRTDLFDIYAIVYEVTPETPHLDGTNNLSPENLVMIARLSDEDRKPASDWTRFEIPFQTVEGKSLDPQKLREGKYNYSVVFSSSKDGAAFIGAPESTLSVDEVTVYFE